MSTDAKPSNVRELYVQAVRIEEDAARQAFLEEACRGEIELRQRVEQLLAARAPGRENLLQLATSDSMSGSSSFSWDGDDIGKTIDSHPEAMGDDQTRDDSVRGQIDVSTHPMIDNYRLLEELGHGGMGTVYMAAQSKPVKRQVALKVIKPGMDSGEVIARFEAERQALAMMDHPHIARVLDGGTTDEGRPYFVMELVRGVPITEFCKRKSLPLRERLGLFVDVCHAVQHAHQKGIIHRDLKPSNIMVTLHDGKPVVKVIDFGVAKALHQELTERTLFTHFSQMVGTPLYMAPEQAEMSGLGVDTRSDIYSLGVVLYELLTGTTPFDRDTMSKLGIDEIRKLIQEQEPPRPSARISTLKAANYSTIEDQRQLDIEDIGKQLNREVDWIVMKALEKDRDRRYETANAFAADIQRYLNDEPVEAYPPSMRYRLGKYSRRHKGILGTVAAVILALMFGVGLATWQAVLASEAAELAEQQRAEAERNMEAAMDAMEQLLANVANPKLAGAPGLQEMWADILKEAVEFYDRFKADSGSSPDVDYRAAKVFLHLGDLMISTKPKSPDVIRNYERGLALAKSIVLQEPRRSDFRELSAKLHFGCGVYYGRTSSLATAFDAKGENHFIMSQQQYASLLQENPGETAFARMQGLVYSRWAVALWRRSPNDPRIEQMFKRARDLGYRVPTIAEARHSSANDPKLEAKYWRKAIADHRSGAVYDDRSTMGMWFTTRLWWAHNAASAVVDEHPEEAEWIWHEGIKTSYEALQDFPAHSFYRRLFESSIESYSKHLLRPENRAKAVQELDALVQSESAFHSLRARVLGSLGDADERLAFITESIRQYPTFADYYFVRADILRDQGDLKNALHDYERVVQLDKNFHSAYEAQGHLLLQMGRYEEAIDAYDTLIPMQGHGMSIWKRRALACFELGRFDNALADLRRAVNQTPHAPSPITWIKPSKIAACPDKEFQAGVSKLADRLVGLNGGSIEFRMARASLLLGLGQFERARDDLSEIIQVEETEYYPIYQAALVALELGDRAAFLELSLRLVSVTDDASEPIAEHFAAWTCALAPNALADYDRAIDLASAAVKQKPDDAQFLCGLGAILMRAGKYSAANKQLEKAIEAGTNNKTSPSYIHYFLAMTEHHLGNAEAAQEHLHEANESAASELASTPAWNRKLTLDLLRNEAESQIDDPIGETHVD